MTRRNGLFIAVALGMALVLATFLSPFASSSPDGLEMVAIANAFHDRGSSPALWRFAVLPEYVMPGVSNEAVATALAGLVGTLVAFLAGLALAKATAHRRAPETSHDPGSD